MKHSLILATPLLLSACFQEPDPKIVAQEYWQALVDKDMETAKQLVSSASRQHFDAHVAAINDPDPLTQVALDDQRTIVVTTINPDTERPHRDRPFETVMVLEDGAWKVDLARTRTPNPPSDLERQLDDMAQDLEQSVDENLDAMEDVIDESIKLLDDAIDKGSRDLGETFEDALRKMNDAMRESVETMKRRREEMQQPPAAPDPETGEGVI